jgi:glycosyltransferase involved in cell wall biosynthesis
LFSSTIIPTIGRESLPKAVNSVLEQVFEEDEFEVIVVNDSGKPLPESDWMQDRRVTVLNTQRRERSVARNTGAAIARGKYLHFLDDDDLLLPGALAAFWELSQGTDSAWLYGNYQSMDNQGGVLQDFIPEMEGDIFAQVVAGEAIPFQASFINAAIFFKIGAFDPQITGVEDRDVGRRLAFFGKTAATQWTVARIRVGEVGSTTNWSKIAELDRYGREKILRTDGMYTRLRQSARDGYWRGRACRALVASAKWNWYKKNILVSLSRMIFLLPVAGLSMLSKTFWTGLRTKIT